MDQEGLSTSEEGEFLSCLRHTHPIDVWHTMISLSAREELGRERGAEKDEFLWCF